MSDASLSQDEINALLQGADDMSAEPAGMGMPSGGGTDLTGAEKSTLRDIAGVIASSQANTLSSISTKNTKIEVTKADMGTVASLKSALTGQSAIITIPYTAPAAGDMFFIFKGADALKIASIM
ncbi:MAG TPA: hypothetical protein DC049_19255, partial [Spirochaetia bacterium]|nr:hypothetical protein [Spirochaetia bacterium]